MRYLVFQAGDLVKLHFTLEAFPRGQKKKNSVVARVSPNKPIIMLLAGNMGYVDGIVPALDLGECAPQSCPRKMEYVNLVFL